MIEVGSDPNSVLAKSEDARAQSYSLVDKS